MGPSQERQGQGREGNTGAEQGGLELGKHGVGREQGWEALPRMFVPPGFAVSRSSASKDAPHVADRDGCVSLPLLPY